MRIRSIKPEFWSSEDIAALPWDDRLIFIGLWSYVDDNAVGRDNEKLIVADLFPLEDDPRETLARVSRGLQNLFERGFIVRYTVEDRAYLAIAKFPKHQRIDKPNKARYPAPTSDNAVIRESVARVSRDPRGDVAPGAVDQRSRGTGEEETCATPLRDTNLPAASPRFDEFWSAYPLRRDRRKAEKAFTAALKRASPDAVINGALRYSQDPNREDRYTKYAEGWLNGDGWLDDPLPARNGNGNQPGAATTKAAGWLELGNQVANTQKGITR